MPVVSFANPKGGVGKSTAALILATGLAHSGLRVAAIDGDPNRTISNWSARASVPNFTADAIQHDNEIIDQIEAAAACNQFVVVDLEGTANLAMSRACSRTDLVLIPLQASPVDARQASVAIKLVLAESRQLRRPIAYRMLFTRLNAAIATRDEREIRRQFDDAEVPMLTHALAERAAFRAMFAHFHSLWQLEPAVVNGLEGAQRNALDVVREVTQICRDLARIGQELHA